MFCFNLSILIFLFSYSFRSFIFFYFVLFLLYLQYFPCLGLFHLPAAVYSTKTVATHSGDRLTCNRPAPPPPPHLPPSFPPPSLPLPPRPGVDWRVDLGGAWSPPCLTSNSQDRPRNRGEGGGNPGSWNRERILEQTILLNWTLEWEFWKRFPAMVRVGPGMGEILLYRPWKNNGKSWNRYSRSPGN